MSIAPTGPERKLAPLNGKSALITGITGQDGSYLAEMLLEKGYEVWGVVRRTSYFNTGRIDHIYQDPHEREVRLHLEHGDLNDSSSINQLLRKVGPHEVYNLAAQSHVKVSFDLPEYTGDVTGLGAVRILQGIREAGLETRFYQASSSEMYGQAVDSPQDESTPFRPRSPYAAAKAYAHFMTRNYRESYGMYTASGILFNHESPRRGETFVTRKISLAVARIQLGRQEKLFLGNMDAKRDWGFAGDYVRAMWQMLQQETPDDYVISTGESHSVREFCELCFEHAGLPLTWEGEGVHERGLGPDGRVLVEIDPRYFRPAEVDRLLGDSSRARRELGWAPSVDFAGLARMMVDSDLELVRQGADP